jgi:hypothetical protein
MKNYSCIILFCQVFIIVSCRTNSQAYSVIPNEKIIGKVINIDSTQSWYIINFEYNSNKKGVFISQRSKCRYPKKSKLIKINQSYNFELSRMIQNNYNEKNQVFEVEGKETWDSSSGIDYFEYSSNTCGLYTWK